MELNLLGYLQELKITLGWASAPSCTGGVKKTTSGETKYALISLGDLPCSKLVADNTSVCNDLAQPQLQVDLALQGTGTVS